MKIFCLPVPQYLQPLSQPFHYPSHNSDYGVEQDFLKYLNTHSELLTNNIDNADWHYLPVFWTRWHLNHNYGQAGIVKLQQAVNHLIKDSKHTFTICQYDDGPKINLGKTIQFLSSRKGEGGIDIPLLSSPLRQPLINFGKKYAVSFVGRISTNKIRKSMQRNLTSNNKALIIDGSLNPQKYANIILRSYISLCPRGYGGSSFRFFESMQLGVVPMLVGDIDTRPFKEYIDWSQCSLYVRDSSQIESEITRFSNRVLIEMGKEAKYIWENKLKYGKWCKYVINILTDYYEKK